MNLLVFSDLDGTLLDHATYSFEPARPALDRLRNLGIPLILTTSKTAAEVAGLHAALLGCEQAVADGEGAGLVELDGGGHVSPPPDGYAGRPPEGGGPAWERPGARPAK